MICPRSGIGAMRFNKSNLIPGSWTGDFVKILTHCFLIRTANMVVGHRSWMWPEGGEQPTVYVTRVNPCPDFEVSCGGSLQKQKPLK